VKWTVIDPIKTLQTI